MGDWESEWMREWVGECSVNKRMNVLVTEKVNE